MEDHGDQHAQHNAQMIDAAAAELVSRVTEALAQGTGFGRIWVEVYYADFRIGGYDVKDLIKYKPGD